MVPTIPSDSSFPSPSTTFILQPSMGVPTYPFRISTPSSDIETHPSSDKPYKLVRGQENNFENSRYNPPSMAAPPLMTRSNFFKPSEFSPL
jgi:hypothetical protein